MQKIIWMTRFLWKAVYTDTRISDIFVKGCIHRYLHISHYCNAVFRNFEIKWSFNRSMLTKTRHWRSSPTDCIIFRHLASPSTTLYQSKTPHPAGYRMLVSKLKTAIKINRIQSVWHDSLQFSVASANGLVFSNSKTQQIRWQILSGDTPLSRIVKKDPGS